LQGRQASKQVMVCKETNHGENKQDLYLLTIVSTVVATLSLSAVSFFVPFFIAVFTTLFLRTFVADILSHTFLVFSASGLITLLASAVSVIVCHCIEFLKVKQ
jgi:hypothetical protein